MRKLMVLIAGVCIAVSSAAETNNYQLKEPFKSKDLNPVKITMVESLKPLIIARKGKALVPIVVSAEQGYYRAVANQLKKYLDKATKADFLITEKPPETGKAIFVGPNNLPNVKAVFDRAQAMPAESLTIESIPEGLVIAGKDDFL